MEGSLAMLGASKCILSHLILALESLLPKNLLPSLLSNTFISPEMADKSQVFHRLLGQEIVLGLGIGKD